MSPFMSSVTPVAALAVDGVASRPDSEVVPARSSVSTPNPQTPATSDTEPSLPAGNWLEPSEVDGDRWVDPADIGTAGAWGTADDFAESQSEGRAGAARGAAAEPSSPGSLASMSNDQSSSTSDMPTRPGAAAGGAGERPVSSADLPPAAAAALRRSPAVEEPLRLIPLVAVDLPSAGVAATPFNGAPRERAADSETSAGGTADGQADSPDEASDGFEHPALEIPGDIAQALGSYDLDHGLPPVLEANHGSDIQDEEWQTGVSYTSDDENSSDDFPSGIERRYCINCTAPLYAEACLECSHVPDEDVALFDATAACAAPAPSVSATETVLVWDERMELHVEGNRHPHPERPDRVRAVMSRLLASGLAERCKRLPARPASREDLLRCHGSSLLTAVQSISEHARAEQGTVYFTPDTYANEHTSLAASLAAGASVDVAVAVARGEARNGAAIVRPPGHHAEGGMAMGFCYFNNAAVAARAAQAAGARRVLVFDWDVHHGNGTQHILESDPSVLYASIHRYDGGAFYPGTGGVREVGKGPGQGFTVNVPWSCGGMGNGDYLAALNHVLLPIAYEFAPDLIIISAGFDAAKGDPIGGCRVTPECFGHMTALLQPVAPLVLLLEGGYNLSATAASVDSCLRVLLGGVPPQLPAPRTATVPGMHAIHETLATQARYWRCLRGLVPQPSSAEPLKQGLEHGHPHHSTPSKPGGLLGCPPATSPSAAHSPLANGNRMLERSISAPINSRSPAEATLDRALKRHQHLSKLHIGKSHRRWAHIHQLSLMALKALVKKGDRGRKLQHADLAVQDMV